MAKIQIKSEKFTPFGGIYSIMEQLLSVFIQRTPLFDGYVAINF